MYDPSLGLLNQLFDSIGLGSLKQNWIGDQNIAIYSISITQVWFHTGQMIVLFVAGLHAIPKDLYEVARIEGASRWQSFRFVTWPMLAPATTIVIAFTTVQTFKAFDLIYAMTRGGLTIQLRYWPHSSTRGLLEVMSLGMPLRQPFFLWQSVPSSHFCNSDYYEQSVHKEALE